MIRCPVCGARDWRCTERTRLHAPTDWRECSHCGLLSRTDALGSGDLATRLRDRVTAGRFQVRTGDPFFVEAYTLRTLALKHGRQMSHVDPEQLAALRHPYSPCPADARLDEIDIVTPIAVSLVMLARSADLAKVLEATRTLLDRFEDIVIMVDDERPEDLAAIASGPIRIVGRALSGNFSGQRNAAQALAANQWVLQLDSDEHLDTATCVAIGRVAAIAERDGALSVGLIRLNHVDGVRSDLFPDIQYRLNRREIRYEGRVHERPALPRAWRDSLIAPNLVIDHNLAAMHVASRSALYETLSHGEGRAFEGDALRQPYRP